MKGTSWFQARKLALLALLAVTAGFALMPRRADAISMDRKFPEGTWCPLENDETDLTFTPSTGSVRIRFDAHRCVDDRWTEVRIDNVAISLASTYQANNGATPNYLSCYNNFDLDPDLAEVAYEFDNDGTSEAFLDLFAADAGTWTLVQNASWFDPTEPGNFNASAPSDPGNDPEDGDDTAGGSLQLGTNPDPEACTADNDAHGIAYVDVSGLTPGQTYVVTGWWTASGGAGTGQSVLEITIDDNIGACCAGQSCTPDLTEADCNAQGGAWQGPGSDCSPDPCVTGACCNGDGSCTDSQTQSACEAGGGSWQGAGTDCANNACPPPAVPAHSPWSAAALVGAVLIVLALVARRFVA